MGLDVYVGSLTRYYCGEWETVLQQLSVPLEWPEASRETVTSADAAALEARRAESLARLQKAAASIGARVEGPGQGPQITDADRRRVAKDIAKWRKRLDRHLKGRIQGDFEWDENPTGPYFTDKPGWEAYRALALWAAYDEHPNLPRPTTSVEDWTTDPAWQASAAKGFLTQYEQLVNGSEIWLPNDFAFTFEVRELGGRKVTIGSSHALLRNLKRLNERTWRADASTLEQWRQEGPERNGSLERNAQFALSVFLALCEQSVAHRLPMKLDY